MRKVNSVIQMRYDIGTIAGVQRRPLEQRLFGEANVQSDLGEDALDDFVW